MALIFSLSAECGSNQSAASVFAKHFHEHSWQMSSGVEFICRAEVFQDSEDNWWTRVCPSDVSQQGITTPEDADRMTEIGIILYKQLQSAPTYRYALVGVEVDEFRTYSELTAMPSDIYFSGLVLASNLWQMMGSPVDFRIFAPGYLWKPYEGEVYKPLIVSSNLRDKFKEILKLG
ncbi:MAG: hypothetical protein GDA48_04260 [Hormoscilla sp. GM102CHS1]|nr:hypothetical protein [Hormoscilla sp. GM102CHS1]